MLVHGDPFVQWDDDLWRGWAVAQSTVRPDSVVMDTPLLNQDLCFVQVVKHLTIEQLLAEPGVAGFADRPSAKPIAANNLDHISTNLWYV